MTRDGKTAVDMASNAGAAINNARDMGKAKLADVKFKEITLPGVSVRGDGTYNVYSVEEKVLFDTGKADIKPDTAEALKQITGSIEQRYNASQVRVMDFADSHGAKDYNKNLSEKRAEAVKNYLGANGNIVAARVSAEPIGRSNACGLKHYGCWPTGKPTGRNRGSYQMAAPPKPAPPVTAQTEPMP